VKCLGSSKVSTNLRVKIVKEAADELEVEEGDRVLFYKDDKGQIIIKKG
jgi:AbrB family looped-hinge helix DNA binding protein